MATRRRSSESSTGGSSKRQLKEKIVQIYESFFKGEDLEKSNPAFWDEIFLLKPKISALEAEIQKLNNEQLVSIKDNINNLFAHCVHTLKHEHHIRVVYSLQTLCALVSSIYKQTASENGFDLINILIGFNVAEERMQNLLLHINEFLTGEYPDSLKSLCLKLLLVFATGTENVSNNTLLEYIIVTQIFESLMQLLRTISLRQHHGYDTLLLITILVNYRKYEGANPYIVKLSILDDELALNGYGQVITISLQEFCQNFINQQYELNSASWISSITNTIGNIFISEDGSNNSGNIRAQKQIRSNNGLLLALYEAVHLNRNFINTLAATQTSDISPATTSNPPSPANTLSQQHQTNLAELTNNLNILEAVNIKPSNLLVTFFEYCSIVMQDTKTDASCNTVKLCFIILSCIAEDQYANILMHDHTLCFKVQLHRMPMRHRKMTVTFTPSQPLAATLLDLLVEFTVSHMMKKLPIELYLLNINIIHRILCYQKRCRVRLNYQWKQLWTGLLALLRFITQNDNNLVKKMDIFHLCLQVVNIFNLFITYGDTFLPTPSSYDELYYEIIRMNIVFENLSMMAMRYSASDSEYKESAMKLNTALTNVKAIIKHFSPKIEQWLSTQSLSTPTEDQILEVVRKNYDSLTLKLQDSLDQYERYAEKPKQSAFFTNLLRNVVQDTKQSIDYATMDLQVILQDFSTIS